VRLRLERDQPLSFLEFNYPIMQAYDFVELARRIDCELQIGGSDQWGNIVGGVELGRRTTGVPSSVLTTPLIATASGVKMGKSVGGAVWLNAERRRKRRHQSSYAPELPVLVGGQLLGVEPHGTTDALAHLDADAVAISGVVRRRGDARRSAARVDAADDVAHWSGAADLQLAIDARASSTKS